MRTMGAWVRRVRVMAAEFQHNLDAVVKEADLEDLKNDVAAIRQEAENAKRSVTAPFSNLDPIKEKKSDEGAGE